MFLQCTPELTRCVSEQVPAGLWRSSGELFVFDHVERNCVRPGRSSCSFLVAWRQRQQNPKSCSLKSGEQAHWNRRPVESPSLAYRGVFVKKPRKSNVRAATDEHSRASASAARLFFACGKARSDDPPSRALFLPAVGTSALATGRKAEPGEGAVLATCPTCVTKAVILIMVCMTSSTTEGC